MQQITELKRKSTMVLFQLEESLASYILRCESNTACLAESFIGDVETRTKNKDFDRSSMKNVLEETYLNEVFEIALKTTYDTPEYEKILSLQTLFRNAEIFSIRNTLAHPNRPFLPVYWYRIASIAADPIVESLGLDDVLETLDAAESGQILNPPDSWLNKYTWQITNNLPKQFEHDITGLVGRNKEIQNLKQLLQNPRNHTIAIVAPGGVGKTALALDLLEFLITDPSTSEWAELIMFISLKNEKLTANGIEKLDAVETIEQMKSAITHEFNEIYDNSLLSYEEALRVFGDKKVFMFIDNLETLLRDSEDTFNGFNNTLPMSWRLLVTSRISISNANIVPLGTLQKHSAMHMAKTYLNRTNGEQIEIRSIENLVIQAHYNPLAIRLTIDLFNSGKEIPESINVANKEIANFSYNNLIETISHDGVAVLESLFIEDNLNRNTLCELLQKNIDDISAAIKELSRTSLITRRQSRDEQEVYSLNSSVKAILLKNPRNIECRKEVQEQITRRKAIANEILKRQQIQGIDEYHPDYIPLYINSNLKIMIGELNNLLTKAKIHDYRLIELFNKFEEAKHIYDEDYIFQRAFARIYLKLSDIANAISCFERAIKLNPDDPVTKLMLATVHRKRNDFEPALTLLNELVQEKKWFTNIYLGTWIFNEYFRALLYDHDYETVLLKTTNWQSAPKYAALLGAYHASAWKRKVESVIDTDEYATIEALNNAVDTMQEVIAKEGYFKLACAETLKLFDEIEICLRRDKYIKTPETAVKWLLFIEEHILEIINAYKDYSQNDAENLIRSFQSRVINNNPFESQRWKEFTEEKFEYTIAEHELHEQSLIETCIYNIPTYNTNKPSRNLFVEDQQKKQYYVHFDKFNGSWKEWRQLKKRMRLAIKPDASSNSSDITQPVLEASVICDY